MTTLKSTGAGGATWEQTKNILRDKAVDRAIEAAQTDLHFKELLEEGRRKAKQQVIHIGPRPEISSGDPYNDRSTSKLSDDEQLSDISDLDDDNDIELRKIQELRKQQIREQFKQKQKKLSQGYGHYDEMEERSMLELSCKADYMVVSFYISSIDRCRIVDMHLSRIAEQFSDTRFVKIDANKSPFVIAKWKIRTLPTLAIIVKGFLVDKIIGFDDFGGADDFPTLAMIRRLAASGVIPKSDGKRIVKSKRAITLLDLDHSSDQKADDDEDDDLAI